MFAWNTLAGAPETGDAANITATYSLDGAADVATNDANPTEIDAVTHQGVYVFDLLQAETDGDLFTLAPVSGTADVELQPVFIYTDQVTPAVIALIDAAISTRSTLTQADILSDATPFAGGNVDVAISSRATSIQAAAILAAIAANCDPIICTDVDIAFEEDAWHAMESLTEEGVAVVPQCRMSSRSQWKDREESWIEAPLATGTVSMTAADWRVMPYSENQWGYGCDDGLIVERMEKRGMQVLRGGYIYHMAHVDGANQLEFNGRDDHWNRASGLNPDNFSHNLEIK